jgi:acyl-CoA thioester hydrolase
MGLSFHDFAATGTQLVIIESYVRYLSPAKYGDVVIVTGAFRDVGAASVTIDYHLTEEKDGRLIAQAWTRGAFVDATTGKPARAPERFRLAFTQAEASSAST